MSSPDPLTDGLNLNETKEWTLGEFMTAMSHSANVAVIKFWSLMLQVPDAPLRLMHVDLIDPGTASPRVLMKLVDTNKAGSDTGGEGTVFECSAHQFMFVAQALNTKYWSGLDMNRETRIKIRRVYIESKDPELLKRLDAQVDAVYDGACGELTAAPTAGEGT